MRTRAALAGLAVIVLGSIAIIRAGGGVLGPGPIVPALALGWPGMSYNQPPAPVGVPPTSNLQPPMQAANAEHTEQVERARQIAVASPEWAIAVQDLHGRGAAFDINSSQGVLDPRHPDLIGLIMRSTNMFTADLAVTVDLATERVGIQYIYDDGSGAVSVFVRDARRDVRRLPPPTIVTPVPPGG